LEVAIQIQKAIKSEQLIALHKNTCYLEGFPTTSSRSAIHQFATKRPSTTNADTFAVVKKSIPLQINVRAPMLEADGPVVFAIPLFCLLAVMNICIKLGKGGERKNARMIHKCKCEMGCVGQSKCTIE
jgi:hypothetical protein